MHLLQFMKKQHAFITVYAKKQHAFNSVYEKKNMNLLQYITKHEFITVYEKIHAFIAVYEKKYMHLLQFMKKMLLLQFMRRMKGVHVVRHSDGSIEKTETVDQDGMTCKTVTITDPNGKSTTTTSCEKSGDAFYITYTILC